MANKLVSEIIISRVNSLLSIVTVYQTKVSKSGAPTTERYFDIILDDRPKTSFCLDKV